MIEETDFLSTLFTKVFNEIALQTSMITERLLNKR